uniref:Uncharacterized protein n=1 Tax=Urocitellus parryii TaxID=9999 RepID=A0A8D2HIT9_UROPR
YFVFFLSFLSSFTLSKKFTFFHSSFLKTFKLGPALFWCSEEATFSQPFSHSTIYLAISGTSLKCFIKARLLENCKESLSFLIAPVTYMFLQKRPKSTFYYFTF